MRECSPTKKLRLTAYHRSNNLAVQLNHRIYKLEKHYLWWGVSTDIRPLPGVLLSGTGYIVILVRGISDP